MTPLYALYGREAWLLPEFNNGKTNVEALEKDLTRRTQIIKLLQENLKKAQESMKA